MSAVETSVDIRTENDPDWEPGKLPRYLSSSQLGMAARCMEQYRQRYVLGNKERPGGSLVLGGTFHYVQKEQFSTWRDGGEYTRLESMEFALVAFDAIIDQNGGEDEIVWDAKLPRLAAKDKTIEMVSAYYPVAEDTATRTIKEVEGKFEVPLSESDRPLLGYIDLETEDEIIDYKTAKAAPKYGMIKPEWRLQQGIYQAALKKNMAWHVITSTKEPRVITPLIEPGYGSIYDSDRSSRMLRYIEQLAYNIQGCYDKYGPDGVWPGGITHPWACDFCGYRPNCDYWR